MGSKLDSGCTWVYDRFFYLHTSMDVPKAHLYRTLNTYWGHHGWLMVELRHFLPLEVLQDIKVFVLRTDIVARDSLVWSFVSLW